MEQPKLYETLSLINGHNDINAELSTAAKNLKNILTDKYISSIYSALNESNDYVKKHPPKEVVLLKALKCYGSEHDSRQIDSIINTLTVFNAISNINKSIDSFSNSSVSALSKNREMSVSHSSALLTKLLLILAVSGKI